MIKQTRGAFDRDSVRTSLEAQTHDLSAGGLAVGLSARSMPFASLRLGDAGTLLRIGPGFDPTGPQVQTLQYPSVIQLSALNGSDGFRLVGPDNASLAGRWVSTAGDVNNDGFDDFLVGAVNAITPSGASAGSTFLVFGQAGGFGASFNLSDIDGTNGYRLDGAKTQDLNQDFSGVRMGAAGDINDDGYDDIVIGATGAAPNGYQSGTAYIVFGGAHLAALDAADGNTNGRIVLSKVNGTDGFRVDGDNEGDLVGSDVRAAGDVDGDGIDDLLVSGAKVSPEGLNSQSGATYLIFGKSGAWNTRLHPAGIDGTDGYVFDGPAGSESGVSISSAGDVNGDGISDIMIGGQLADPNDVNMAGATWILFGGTAHLAALDAADASVDGHIVLENVNGTDGFRLDGIAVSEISGRTVSSAGDINGDGFADMVIGSLADNGGTNTGSAYVVFGKASGFAAHVSLSSLNGTTGFRIDGAAAGDIAGYNVRSAGDFNGDGFDDLLVSAYCADPNGGQSGSTFVVFGKAASFSSVLNLGTLTSDEAIRIDGVAAGDFSGCSVSPGGDINGDSFDDLIIGAHSALIGGIHPGAAYVLFGHAPLEAVTRTGSAADQTIHGADSNDTLLGQGGADILLGHGADDVLVGGAGGDVLDGAAGVDTASYATSSLGVTASLLNPAGNFGDAAGDSYVSIENLLGSTKKDFLIGDGMSNTIDGSAGHDVLDGGDNDDILIGGAGSDALIGGNGIDTASYASAAAKVTVSLVSPSFNTNDAAGDTYNSVENLIGTAFNDNLTGDANDNVLIGGLGNDSIVGGSNSAAGDTVSYATASGGVTLHLGLGTVTGAAGIDSLSGIENVIGSAFDDRITAMTNSQLRGGDGNDTYDIRGNGNTIIELAGAAGGVDTVETTLTVYSLAANVENLTFTGNNFAAFTGTGNALANVITGANAADTLDGGAGIDTLIGGKGNDIYYVDDPADVVQELPGQNGGTDTIRTTCLSFTLGADLEKLEFVGTGDFSGTGNGLANTIVGGTGNDVLDGGTGTDILQGGLGDDLYIVDSKFESLFEPAGFGFDAVHAKCDQYVLGSGLEDLKFIGVGSFKGNGNSSANTITGGAASDVLNGLGGNDRLEGGGAGDTLTGSAGLDTYRIANVSDSTSDSFDTISGFEFQNAHADADKFDLDVTVAAIDTTIAGGTLDQGAAFDIGLTNAVTAAALGALHAVLFNPDAGFYSGKTFLIVDANGAAGYQSGQDLVFALTSSGHIGQIDVLDFT